MNFDSLDMYSVYNKSVGHPRALWIINELCETLSFAKQWNEMQNKCEMP